MKSTTKSPSKAEQKNEVTVIPIKYHPKTKYVVDKDLEPKDVTADTPTRPMSTLDLIETVIIQPTKGPHGEPVGIPYPDQNKIFQILSKIEEVPADATEFELKESQLKYIQKRAKNFPWGRYDPFFKEFEELIGVVYDSKED